MGASSAEVQGHKLIDQQFVLGMLPGAMGKGWMREQRENRQAME